MCRCKNEHRDGWNKAQYNLQAKVLYGLKVEEGSNPKVLGIAGVNNKYWYLQLTLNFWYCDKWIIFNFNWNNQVLM